VKKRTPHNCQRCGGPIEPTHFGTYRRYCSAECRRQSFSNTKFRSCPVTGCYYNVRPASLATCKACWGKVSPPLRDSLAKASYAFKCAGQSDYEEKRAELDQARDLAIAAAEGQLARVDEVEQKRARRREIVRQKTRRHLVA
jgi:hypothetical protein